MRAGDLVSTGQLWVEKLEAEVGRVVGDVDGATSTTNAAAVTHLEGKVKDLKLSFGTESLYCAPSVLSAMLDKLSEARSKCGNAAAQEGLVTALKQFQTTGSVADMRAAQDKISLGGAVVKFAAGTPMYTLACAVAEVAR